MNPFSNEAIEHIFKKSARNPNLIGTNEGITVEYKESFGWKSRNAYLRAMAAFANRDGGYIIFGIKNKPHELIGLSEKALERFESLDNQVWTTSIRECFAPEIKWEKTVYSFQGKKYGIIYTYSAKEKPVICKKDIDVLRKAAIYYRYNSQNSEIDYPELKAILDNEKSKINEAWMKTISQIGESGVSKTVLLDLNNGRLSGNNNNLYIDESLLNEISFIEEGTFVDTGGSPALKIIGEVRTVVGGQKVIVEQELNKAINADEIIKSFITQKIVNNPKEFVKQICYQNTGNMPAYYYLSLASCSHNEALAFIETIPIYSKAKDLLKRRIQNREIKYCKIPNTNTFSANRKQYYKQAIVDNSIVLPTDETEIKYLLMAIRGMSQEEVNYNKGVLFNLMYEIYITYFNSRAYSYIKPEFRYALCWLDEALYMDR